MIIERSGAEFVARCPEVPDATARGGGKEEALESIRVVIRQKFADGSSPSPPDDHPA